MVSLAMEGPSSLSMGRGQGRQQPPQPSPSLSPPPSSAATSPPNPSSSRHRSAQPGGADPGLRGSAGGAKKGSSPARDCLENMTDSVGHLRDAAKELGGNMGRAGTPAFRWHLSNVQTWCSATLTDENTCLDGLSRGRQDHEMRATFSMEVRILDVSLPVASPSSLRLSLIISPWEEHEMGDEMRAEHIPDGSWCTYSLCVKKVKKIKEIIKKAVEKGMLGG